VFLDVKKIGLLSERELSKREKNHRFPPHEELVRPLPGRTRFEQ
jgi:hypothetical protein